MAPPPRVIKGTKLEQIKPKASCIARLITAEKMNLLHSSCIMLYHFCVLLLFFLNNTFKNISVNIMGHVRISEEMDHKLDSSWYFTEMIGSYHSIQKQMNSVKK